MKHLDEGFVEVVYHGQIGMAHAVNATDRAAELASQDGLTRFLVDTRQCDFSLSKVDLYAMHQRLPESLPAGSRVSLLCRDGALSEEDLSFIETVCLNRGQQYRVFIDAAKGKAWLLDGSE